ncbi:MAG: transglycosylase domain-containing protein, partial [Bdellovibrionota bacterium]
MVRKIKEVILASRIERNLTKPQILYLYLNQIYLGHGSYGVQAAAKTYFDKDVSQLTVAESALLAGLPQAPGKYSPLLNPKKAKERQLYVLKRMFENKYITAQEMSDAAAQLLKIYSDRDLNAQYGAYYVEHLRRYLTEKYGEKAVYEDGLSVFVPSTRQLMVTARKSLVEGLLTVDKRVGYRGPIKTLHSETEVAETLRDMRIKLIERKLHHRILMPDGRVDVNEALQNSGLSMDTMLLVPGEIYDAVVTHVDDKNKTASVLIGAVKADLSMDTLKWARTPKDEKDPTILSEEPKVPSKVLKKWDVIKVRVVQIGGEGVQAALEQDPQLQGALLSMETKTGYVIAMEGGFDYDKSEFNRAIQSQRQPGSSFKPLIYSAAVEKGFTPATIIVDSPIVYEDTESGKWKPDNFESKFYGDTTFRHALIKSRNVPTIKILQAIQVPYVLNYVKRLGLTGQFRADLSLSLGSGGISLLELAKFYALFPRLGRKIKPIFVTKVLDRTGVPLEEEAMPNPASSAMVAAVPSPPPLLQGTAPTPEGEIRTVDALGQPVPLPSSVPVNPNLAAIGIRGVVNVTLPTYPLAEDPEQVLDPNVAYLMTHLMKEVITFGTGHAAKSLGRIAAGKTGTTNDSVDAWFMGFTPQVVTGAWVGYDSQKSIGSNETGARAALPIWLNFMREAVKPYPESD